VWQATGPGGFPVALKFVALEDKTGAAELRALEVIRGVRHPNLLSIMASWEVSGWLVIAMELADGTLWDRLKEAQRQALAGIPVDELREYMREAAKGLDYLNQPHPSLQAEARQGIQHRDVKPQNLMLIGGGVKVADFGLARVLTRSVTKHTGSLTAAYAAPEFFGGQTTNRSDQYSLAVTYCQLRGGQLPYSGNPAQIMAGHLQGTPDLTMLPEAERPAVLRALAKEPRERWPSCRAFVETLSSG
jgi:hypothetical protein